MPEFLERSFVIKVLQKTYDKPALTIAEQISLLKSRGLLIQNSEKAAHYLKFISYYRFSGYAQYFVVEAPFQPRFREGITFDHILNLYIFDRELRLIVMDAIERIEVAARTVISNTLSVNYHPHWYLDQACFNSGFRYQDFIQAIKQHTAYGSDGTHKKQEDSFRYYYTKYSYPNLPPSWMIAEALPLGTWSQIYAFLAARKDKKQIAKEFGLGPVTLQSWLHSLTHLRNLCAHHSRLWNRHFKITPQAYESYKRHFLPAESFYAQASMIHVLMDVIAEHNHWPQRLKKLMDTFEFSEKMGFPRGWYKDAFWGLQLL